MAPALLKRKRPEQTSEITFDPEARQEYLSGFHKRKQQRIQNAREQAIKRDKEDRVTNRRHIREQRKEDLEKHVAEVNAELKKQSVDASDDDGGESAVDGGEWAGIEEVSQEPEVVQDEEYVDEDKFTTVTVEEMGGDDEAEEDEERSKAAQSNGRTADAAKKKRKDTKPKVKKKKFRYESKAERSASRYKQKAKDHKAAAARREKES